jgi:hypothetical protein
LKINFKELLYYKKSKKRFQALAAKAKEERDA